MIKNKEKDNFSGSMDRPISEIGRKGTDMAMEFGQAKKGKVIMENGSKERGKDMEPMLLKVLLCFIKGK